MANLDRDSLIAQLKAEHAQFLAVVRGLTEEQMTRRFEGVDGWTSVADVVKHLAGGEKGMLMVAQRCAAGEPPPNYEGFDLDYYNRRQVEKRKELSPAEALAEYEEARRQTLATLESLTEEQLARPAAHPTFGDVTVAQLFRIMALHENMHRKDVLDLLARSDSWADLEAVSQ